MTAKGFLRFFVAASLIVLVLGHGMLFDPASRNSAWRFFPNRPAQYTDNELNCGGFSVQWSKNKGKCGVCGDAYHLENPKYVYPGRYAKDGFITNTYNEGQQIEVKVKITSNHQGFFRFSVGKLVKRPITQEQLTHVLLQPDGSNTWLLHSSRTGIFKIKLVLPKGLTCDHCVLQWWWTVGNNWGCDENGDCGVGKGKRQETFVNCADIKIVSAGGPEPPITEPPPTEKPTSQAPPTEEPTTQTPTTAKTTTATKKPQTTVVVTTPNPSTQRTSTEGPATTAAPATKPPSGGCHATGDWAGNPNMDAWCSANCAAGYCPSTHCKCA